MDNGCRARGFILIFILLLSGCAGREPSRRTWADWMTMPHAARGDVLPPTGTPAAVDADREPELLAGYRVGDGAKVGPGFDLEMRNPDFPNTYIQTIQVDVTSPFHWVHLVWTGPLAESAPKGPFHSNPGQGTGTNNCNDVEESNRDGSLCTPKGVFPVAGFANQLRTVRSCHYVTWVHLLRGVGLHSHKDIPYEPASHGCVRLEYDVAKLIHNNSRAGMTLIVIGGDWHWFHNGG